MMKAKVWMVIGVLALSATNVWAQSSACQNDSRGIGQADFRCVQQTDQPEWILSPWSLIVRFYACDNTPIEMRGVEGGLGSRAECDAAKADRMLFAISQGLVVSDSNTRR